MRIFSTSGDNITWLQFVPVSVLLFDFVPCFQTASRLMSGATLGKRLPASAPHSPSVTLKASVVAAIVTMIGESLGIDKYGDGSHL